MSMEIEQSVHHLRKHLQNLLLTKRFGLSSKELCQRPDERKRDTLLIHSYYLPIAIQVVI